VEFSTPLFVPATAPQVVAVEFSEREKSEPARAT